MGIVGRMSGLSAGDFSSALSVLAIDEMWAETLRPDEPPAVLVAVTLEHLGRSFAGIDPIRIETAGGYMDLQFIAVIKGRAIFQAIGLRPASEPARPSDLRWLLSSELLRAGPPPAA